MTRAGLEHVGALLDDLDAVVWEADPSGRFTFASAAAERLLGYPPDAWLADGFRAERLHPDDREAALEAIGSAAIEGRPFDLRYRMARRNGSVAWVRDLGRAFLEGGSAAGTRGVMVEIPRHGLEGERRSEPGDTDEARSAFLRTLSHDLRTPIAAILGLAVTLEREDIEITPAEARDLAARIAVNARKLDRIVNDLREP